MESTKEFSSFQADNNISFSASTTDASANIVSNFGRQGDFIVHQYLADEDLRDTRSELHFLPDKDTSEEFPYNKMNEDVSSSNQLKTDSHVDHEKVKSVNTVTRGLENENTEEKTAAIENLDGDKENSNLNKKKNTNFYDKDKNANFRHENEKTNLVEEKKVGVEENKSENLDEEKKVGVEENKSENLDEEKKVGVEENKSENLDEGSANLKTMKYKENKKLESGSILDCHVKNIENENSAKENFARDENSKENFEEGHEHMLSEEEQALLSDIQESVILPQFEWNEQTMDLLSRTTDENINTELGEVQRHNELFRKKETSGNLKCTKETRYINENEKAVKIKNTCDDERRRSPEGEIIEDNLKSSQLLDDMEDKVLKEKRKHSEKNLEEIHEVLPENLNEDALIRADLEFNGFSGCELPKEFSEDNLNTSTTVSQMSEIEAYSKVIQNAFFGHQKQSEEEEIFEQHLDLLKLLQDKSLVEDQILSKGADGKIQDILQKNDHILDSPKSDTGTTYCEVSNESSEGKFCSNLSISQLPETGINTKVIGNNCTGQLEVLTAGDITLCQRKLSQYQRLPCEALVDDQLYSEANEKLIDDILNERVNENGFTNSSKIQSARFSDISKGSLEKRLAIIANNAVATQVTEAKISSSNLQCNNPVENPGRQNICIDQQINGENVSGFLDSTNSTEGALCDHLFASYIAPEMPQPAGFSNEKSENEDITKISKYATKTNQELCNLLEEKRVCHFNFGGYGSSLATGKNRYSQSQMKSAFLKKKREESSSSLKEPQDTLDKTTLIREEADNLSNRSRSTNESTSQDNMADYKESELKSNGQTPKDLVCEFDFSRYYSSLIAREKRHGHDCPSSDSPIKVPEVGQQLIIPTINPLRRKHQRGYFLDYKSTTKKLETPNVELKHPEINSKPTSSIASETNINSKQHNIQKDKTSQINQISSNAHLTNSKDMDNSELISSPSSTSNQSEINSNYVKVQFICPEEELHFPTNPADIHFAQIDKDQLNFEYENLLGEDVQVLYASAEATVDKSDDNETSPKLRLVNAEAFGIKKPRKDVTCDKAQFYYVSTIPNQIIENVTTPFIKLDQPRVITTEEIGYGPGEKLNIKIAPSEDNLTESNVILPVEVTNIGDTVVAQSVLRDNNGLLDNNNELMKHLLTIRNWYFNRSQQDHHLSNYSLQLQHNLSDAISNSSISSDIINAPNVPNIPLVGIPKECQSLKELANIKANSTSKDENNQAKVFCNNYLEPNTIRLTDPNAIGSMYENIDGDRKEETNETG